MRLRKFFLFSITCLTILAFLMSGVNRVPVEKVSVSSALGYDIEKSIDGEYVYSVPTTIYNIEESTKSSRTIVTKAKTLGETREDRQTKVDKKFLLGFEKVYILSEDFARHGIKKTLDILLNNSYVNDTALMCVCKGKAEDILKFKIEGYASSGDFIEGLIKNSKEYNFYTNQYKLIDAFLRVGAEGRNLILPCIEVKENNIDICGMAIFDKEKLIDIISWKEAKALNVLKENNAFGMISMENENEKYLNFYGKSKRKVKCYKEGKSFRFVINLNLNGDVVANEMYDDIINSPQNQKKLEDKLSQKLKKNCDEFINKMKSEYKTDCLELGRIAAAKFGRNTGENWDEVVSNSSIEVNVKVKVDRLGRGDY